MRRTTTRSHYHLYDPFLRFHFRFMEPNLEMLEQDLRKALWERIRSQFHAFVGMTAFEELCREWTLTQARANQLPFPPEIVGSHWSKNAQVDVVALNWQDKAILLGECKWGTHPVGRSVVRELVDKAPLVVPDKDWQTHYVLFSRAGFTSAVQEEAQSVGAQLIDLNRLDNDLCKALADPQE
jgi:AAA+ ATPase superfamily predicted ATPase